MRKFKFKWQEITVVPIEKKNVAIMFKDKKSKLPFEIGAGYYYNGRWFINGYSPAVTGPESHREIRVLVWSYFSFDKESIIEERLSKEKDEKVK